MAQLPMYLAKVNSPDTTLTTAIDAVITTIVVDDASSLGPAPNVMVILSVEWEEMPI